MTSPHRLSFVPPVLILLLCCGSFFTPLVRADGPVAFTVGAEPRLRGPSLNIVAADFNGDSRADFAATNESEVVVYLGNGAGDFGRAHFYPAGTLPRALAVADLNGDGSLDLVVVNFDNLSVLLNNGSGSFQPPVNFPTGQGPTAVATGDFNADGKTDVAVVNGQSNNVTILLGDGNGGFASSANYPAGQLPVSVVVGDFDEDGALDLVVSTYTSEAALILRGDGSGGFNIVNSYELGGNGSRLVVGDFNHDGRLDFAVGVYNIFPNNHMAVFVGRGDGTFIESDDIRAPDPQGLATADFDGDGNLDLACTSYFVPTVVLAYGNGKGRFTPPDKTRLPRHPFPFGLASADFNEDGRPDLAIANFRSPRATILLNLATTHSSATH
ncbi:hypothetical protein BH20VER3_BH20VER3_15770 [soil metagenome]